MTKDPIFEGQLVQVQARTWPGINKPGGVGRVVRRGEQDVDVQYVLGGGEKGVGKKGLRRQVAVGIRALYSVETRYSVRMSETQYSASVTLHVRTSATLHVRTCAALHVRTCAAAILSWCSS